VSGILGILSLSGQPINTVQFARMMTALGHRGPDGSGQWIEGHLGLGYEISAASGARRSSFTFRSNDGHLIVADARIDNRKELIAALGLRNDTGDIGDAELIWHAYVKWGERCPERLLGDFSFAIWDAAAQQLFCARDCFGVKPFCYYHSADDVFVFASEIKALLATNLVPRRINEYRIVQYLRSDLEDKTTTFYQEVFRLAPAHSLTITLHKIEPHCYWSPDPSSELSPQSDETFAEQFRELFFDAVYARISNCRALGSMLSGGLDSSSIVCASSDLLARAGDQVLHTFSAVFDEVPESDERPFIEAVISGHHLKPHFINGDALGPLMDCGDSFYCQDEPFYAPNLFLHQKLYDAARAHGVCVVLDGFDGDTVVSHGLHHLGDLARRCRWISLASELGSLSTHAQCSVWNVIRYQLLGSIVPQSIRTVYGFARRAKGSDRGTSQILNADFADQLSIDEQDPNTVSSYKRGTTHSRRTHYRSLMSGLIPLALEVADRAAAASSIEPRYPFFDRRLVEFCLALPPEQKLKKGWTRVVMRRALRDTLPHEVCWRGTKSDLSPNFTRALLKFDRKVLDQRINDAAARVWQYADIKFVREAYQRYLDAPSSDDALVVWKTVTLALWLQHTQIC
jgi:asparagine synthase (glutamine-hydrolysing)